MTIEDKAKLYDEALKKAKDVIEQNPLMEYLKKGIEYILPELKESEDERIRKCVKYAIDKLFLKEKIVCDVHKDDVLAWLKKQGEQKQDPCEHCDDKRLNCHNFPCIKKKAFEQGKSVFDVINEEKVDNTNKIEPKDYRSIDPHFGKPIDKVEPKFKQGQWIVWKDKCYEVNYNGCGYELIDQNGLSTSLEYGTVDTSARLWDVTKDAKAGDVLVIQETDFTYESIFIFNKIENNHIIQYLHYFITDTDEEVCKVKSVGGFIGDVGDNVHPATKEQRNQLKKAMADAGYTFDFDKIELKKIYKKPAWSYEDENLLKLSFENLTELKDMYGEEYGKVGNCISWLKSLKQRYTWKPSNEQMIALNDAILLNEEDHYNGAVLSTLLEQLKKLK